MSTSGLATAFSWLGNSSGQPPSPEPKEISPEQYAKLQERIRELLTFCAEKEVDVPEDLKQALLGNAPEETSFCDREHRLSAAQNSKQSQIMLDDESEIITEFREHMKILQGRLPNLDLRVKDGSYKVMVPDKEADPLKSLHFSKDGDDSSEQNGIKHGGAKQDIATIRNSNPGALLCQALTRCFLQRGKASIPKMERVIMDGVNLHLEPSKMYLVLGAPGSGKSTLLKMIANKLSKAPGEIVGGSVSVNGIEEQKGVYWSNLVSYIDQIDRLHPWLTVWETCEFAWKCRSGGTHRMPWWKDSPEADALVKEFDENFQLVTKVLDALGLTRVKDTFVGDQSSVRGVSGGEKKRVTVAEMFCTDAVISCCDEISTGLDAATTYDITKLMSQVSRVRNNTIVVSLLQPPPETVANFDELILLSEGRIIYSGPVEDVVEHFQSLGYELPDRMDVADWLQTLPTKDGANFLKEAEEEDNKGSKSKRHLSTEEFSKKFYESERGQRILSKLNSPPNEKDAQFVRDLTKDKYKNGSYESMKLVVRRELLLWWRDKYQIKAKIMQALAVGVIDGTLFWQSTSPTSIVGLLFQAMFIQIIGAMLLIVKQFPQRSIFYKQQDAKFFPTWCYVIGRSISNIPNSLVDSLLFGTIVYWFAGLAFGDGATIGSYFMFLLILFMTSYSVGLLFSIFPSIFPVVTIAQAGMAVMVVIFMLFSGFTVQPDIVPDWWIWAYWCNPLSWTYRGLVVNEFDSGAYDSPSASDPSITQGESLLIVYGMTDRDGEPYDFAWAGYSILVLMGFGILGILVSNWNYTNVRFATGKSLAVEIEDEEEEEGKQAELQKSMAVAPIPFKRADLTFKDMHYVVTSSITKEELELLKGIDGVVEAGKMTALMGSSGAGKTTLMDVLALRKNSGEITGDVRVNGHPQEQLSFRRMTGYVEQFDTQTEQLTIRETCEFSAKLRLDQTDPAVTPESTKDFVDMTLEMLELTVIADLQVGSDETGGLSFEQKKRLSIAVEVVSNPSILFLDEPTSGLDARAAMIVMRGLKRIAASGRAVCATIHQPSISIFSDFDSLLLLKRGGEVVFHGELGEGSQNLIDYLERFDATPKILRGENPATWMLTTIGAGSAVGNKQFDYAGAYQESKLRARVLQRIEEINSEASEENHIGYASKYATSASYQRWEVLKRGMTVYFRSPTYNVVRNIVSITVALIFGSCFINYREPSNESELSSVFNSIFVAVLFVCVSSQNTVLNVFEKERNMFYRHKASNMYSSAAVLMAYSVAEFPFMIISSFFFTLPFYWIMGLASDAGKFFLFYVFTYLGFNVFTFAGQMHMSLVRDSETAQAIGGLFVTFSVLFSGLLIRPDQIPDFWVWAYWCFPGQYLFQGLFMTQFYDDETLIEASPGTPFYNFLRCDLVPESELPCEGTIAQWLEVNFSDFDRDNVYYCGIYLACFILLTRLVTFWALTNLNYQSN